MNGRLTTLALLLSASTFASSATVSRGPAGAGVCSAIRISVPASTILPSPITVGASLAAPMSLPPITIPSAPSALPTQAVAVSAAAMPSAAPTRASLARASAHAGAPLAATGDARNDAEAFESAAADLGILFDSGRRRTKLFDDLSSPAVQAAHSNPNPHPLRPKTAERLAAKGGTLAAGLAAAPQAVASTPAAALTGSSLAAGVIAALMALAPALLPLVYGAYKKSSPQTKREDRELAAVGEIMRSYPLALKQADARRDLHGQRAMGALLASLPMSLAGLIILSGISTTVALSLATVTMAFGVALLVKPALGSDPIKAYVNQCWRDDIIAGAAKMGWTEEGARLRRLSRAMEARPDLSWKTLLDVAPSASTAYAKLAQMLPRIAASPMTTDDKRLLLDMLSRWSGFIRAEHLASIWALQSGDAVIRPAVLGFLRRFPGQTPDLVAKHPEGAEIERLLNDA